MADTHTPINEEVEVTLKLRVKFTQASYHGERKDEELVAEINQAKANIKSRILELVEDEYASQSGLSEGKGGYVKFDYEISNADKFQHVNN